MNATINTSQLNIVFMHMDVICRVNIIAYCGCDHSEDCQSI